MNGIGVLDVLLSPRESIKLCFKKDRLINEIDLRNQNIAHTPINTYFWERGQ